MTLDREVVSPSVVSRTAMRRLVFSPGFDEYTWYWDEDRAQVEAGRTLYFPPEIDAWVHVDFESSQEAQFATLAVGSGDMLPASIQIGTDVISERLLRIERDETISTLWVGQHFRHTGLEVTQDLLSLAGDPSTFKAFDINGQTSPVTVQAYPPHAAVNMPYAPNDAGVHVIDSAALPSSDPLRVEQPDGGYSGHHRSMT